MARWLYLCETSCKDTKREKEFIEWWSNVHSPDVLNIPGFLKIRLFEVQNPMDGRGKFIILYEVETDDIDKTMETRQEKRLCEAEAGHGSASFITIWNDILWEQIASINSGKIPDPELQKWVRITETYCADLNQEDAFNDWYNNIHLPVVMKATAYISAVRYKIKQTHIGRDKYLSVYEVRSDDINSAIVECRRHIQEEKDRGDDPDLARSTWPPITARLIAENNAK